MTGFAAAVLLCLLIGAVHGSNLLAKDRLKSVRTLPRQTPSENCTVADMECETAFQDLLAALALGGSSNIQAAASMFCTVECVQLYVDFYTCLGDSNTAALINNFYCGQNGDQYCVSYDDQQIDDIFDNNPCLLDSNAVCEASCANALETVRNQLGCCVDSFYTTVIDIDCDAVSGNVCPGVVGAGFVARIGLGLVTLFAMLAAWAHVALF